MNDRPERDRRPRAGGIPLGPDSPLYAIVDADLHERPESRERLGALIAGGCGMVQLRAKKLEDREFYTWAKLLAERASELGALLIVNDRVDIAHLAGADGVHLGQEDLSVSSARRILGPTAIIGWSTHDESQVRKGESLPVDYLAIGPVFRTLSKKAPDPTVGLEGVRRARELTHKPLVAIGGLTLDNAPDVVRAGADGLAVISALSDVVTGKLQATANRWTRVMKGDA